MARKKKQEDGDLITIKKYANRRLYNTATSSYVTLEHLCTMVKGGQEFEVFDAKTKEDITRSVLAQIIFEEESKGQNLLPTKFLRQLIQYYGDNLQSVLPGYLDMSMENFHKNREKLESDLREAIGPIKQFEEQIKNNIANFENALRSFKPFSRLGKQDEEMEDIEEEKTSESGGDEISQLKDQLAQMQKQLNRLAKEK